MNKYKYVGTTETVIFELGVIYPGQVIVTDKIINHPLFVAVKNKKREK